MQALVPKHRRPKFELKLRIIDLNNVPLVSGTSFVKWQVPHSTAGEQSGRTEKCTIKDHKVAYDYSRDVHVRLTISKDGILEEYPISFEVLQEYGSLGKGERIMLGKVKMNLAEYVGGNDDEGEDIERRYLMQESKINSTLKIAIHMTQIEGDRQFSAPPLKSAPVFGGIAGVLTSDTKEIDEIGAPGVPITLSTKSKENGELQDMYRRTLAAYWAATPGELRADECIEDIFAGGDGWGDCGSNHDTNEHNAHLSSPFNSHGHETPRARPKEVDEDRLHPAHATTNPMSRGTGGQPRTPQGMGMGMGNNRTSSPNRNPFMSNSNSNTSHGPGITISAPPASTAPNGNTASGVTGRMGLEQQAQNMQASTAGARESASRRQEVEELKFRQDLRSWKLPSYLGSNGNGDGDGNAEVV